MSEKFYPKPEISKEEFDTPNFWQNYLKRVHELIPDSRAREALSLVLFDEYECGNYEVALAKLEQLTQTIPRSIEVTWPYLHLCKGVLARAPHPDDEEYRLTSKRWNAWRDLLPTWLFKRFSRRPAFLRCKYCGRFVRYLDPDGWSIVNGIWCSKCSRSYPMPSLVWDSVGGQAYMFYRRSVRDTDFYRDAMEHFTILNFNDEQYGGKPVPRF